MTNIDYPSGSTGAGASAAPARTTTSGTDRAGAVHQPRVNGQPAEPAAACSRWCSSPTPSRWRSWSRPPSRRRFTSGWAADHGREGHGRRGGRDPHGHGLVRHQGTPGVAGRPVQDDIVNALSRRSARVPRTCGRRRRSATQAPSTASTTSRCSRVRPRSRFTSCTYQAGRRSADRRHAAADHTHVRLEGGDRVRGIRVVLVDVRHPHDHRVRAGGLLHPRSPDPVSGETPTGFDPRLSAVDFSFKWLSDPLRLPAQQCLASRRRHIPGQGLLAKDYDSFRQLMLDRLATTLSDWI